MSLAVIVFLERRAHSQKSIFLFPSSIVYMLGPGREGWMKVMEGFPTRLPKVAFFNLSLFS